MNIITLFAPGDKVWVVHNCRAILVEVSAVIVSHSGVSYAFDHLGNFYESECFATKEELLRHVAG